VRSPSYDLVAVDDSETYRVTVVPKHGKTVTLHVVKGADSWTTNEYDRERRRYVRSSGSYWYVKTSPEFSEASPSYITRHKMKEDAAMGANRRARAYGRACSTPIGKARSTP
jgi:hypothetical protein